MEIKSKLVACAGYLPENIVTNADLQARGLDTTDEWIQTRSGIKQRHIATDETVADMASKAILKMLANTVDVKVDLLIVATATAEKAMPSVANLVQKLVPQIASAVAFDMNVACSGFVFALSVADSMIKTGKFKNAIIVGADKMSRIVDWSDRNTAVLFGDGAGCVLLQAESYENFDKKNKKHKGIIDFQLFTNGNLADILYCNEKNHTVMKGNDVFRTAVLELTKLSEKMLIDSGFDKSEIDLLIPHQANKRIITALQDKLELKDEQVISSAVELCANTSAASIPLALSQSFEANRVKDGNLILFLGVGAGMSWGGVFVRY
jgi:3-oxoacyl-[acyl-carrier-protein] synthase-3